MTIHGDFMQYAESTGQDPFTLQNKKLLKVFLHYGPVMARIGSMVAYQGDARFEHAGSGGTTKWLKKAFTGEGVPLMSISGAGEVFLADQASDVQVIYLENDMVTVNGQNILAFSSSIQWDIQRVQGAGMTAGGLFNTVLHGTGYVAVTTKGQPVILDVTQAPTCGDPNAVVLWTSGVTTSLKTDMSMKTFIGRGSGESFQLAFGGHGHVVIQPAENVGVSGNSGNM
jgi:uncharacterized protein (AIM24 family)